MYNNSFKEQAVDMAKNLGVRKAAKELKVSERSIHNWIKKSAKNGQDAQISAKRSRKRYSYGYKKAALKLASKIGMTAATKELGLYKNAIYNWRNIDLDKEITTPEDSSSYVSMVSLKRENAALKREAETFKEALRLFVKQSSSENEISSSLTVDDSATGVVHTCRHCGNKYIARVPYQKYCSEQCRIKHYSLRTKESSFDSIMKRLVTTR